MKVSSDFASGEPTFTGVAGGNGFDTLVRLCLPNASNDGFWEPMLYQAADGAFMVGYTDDTPPENGDGACNQIIRVGEYSLTERKLLTDIAVGECPGDKRDGMPVVQKNAAGDYFMVIESLGAPSSQIVLLSSSDGGRTFSGRQVLADVAIDGGGGVGCPYLAFSGNEPYVAYYHVHSTSTGAKFGAFVVRGFDESLARTSEQVVELRRHWSGADDLDILYWGGIHLIDRAEDGTGHLHLVGSAWSHSFVEAWVPLR